MRLLDRFERRAGWLAFPGLFRFFTLLGVLAFVLNWLREDLDLAAILDFDRQRVLSGELWRIVTFPFAPDALRRWSMIGVLMLYFAVVIGFLINDSLEQVWGVFRTSMFLYSGYLFLLLANFLFPAYAWSGGLLYSSAFLAFATHFPRHEFLLFFILPVQVRFLAIIMAAGLLIQAAGQPQTIPFLVLGLLNYGLFVGLPFLRDRKSLAKAAARRRQHDRASKTDDESFHRCSVCGRTEKDEARLDFRVGRDGKEYCLDHLPAAGE